MFGTPKTRQVKYEMENNDDSHLNRPTTSLLITETRIQVLLEEYRAMYGLLMFRLDVIDRRVPAVGGTLAAILASATAMPVDTRIAFLLGLPLAAIGLIQSVCQHAQSKEDHLRRIDEIERLVNALAGEVLLVFQSQHPNRRRQPGGRSGFGTVFNVLTAVLIMLSACGVLAGTTDLIRESACLSSYYGYLITLTAVALGIVGRFRSYRYERPQKTESPIFRGRGLPGA